MNDLFDSLIFFSMPHLGLFSVWRLVTKLQYVLSPSPNTAQITFSLRTVKRSRNNNKTQDLLAQRETKHDTPSEKIKNFFKSLTFLFYTVASLGITISILSYLYTYTSFTLTLLSMYSYSYE